MIKRFQHKGYEEVSFVYPLTCHCTFSIILFYYFIKDGITDMAWNERMKCLAACSWDGWMTVNCRWSMEWACHLDLLLLFFVDLVDGQRPTHHSRWKGRWLLLEFCLASKRETNGRRGSGRRQEIGRQFHFSWVSFINGRINVFEKWDWTKRIDWIWYSPRSEYLDCLFLTQEKWVNSEDWAIIRRQQVFVCFYFLARKHFPSWHWRKRFLFPFLFPAVGLLINRRGFVKK